THGGTLPAMQVVSRENRAWRNGRQNVSGQFGLRKGKKQNREQRPNHEKFREGVSHLLALAHASGKGAAPIAPGLLCRRTKRGDCVNSPGHQREQQHRQIKPERLLVLEKVCSKPFEVMLK